MNMYILNYFENINFSLFYFLISFLLFCVGIFGIISIRKNILIVLMSIELMLLSIDLIFIGLSFFLDDILGQLVALILLTVAASEAAIGLAILVSFERVRGNILINFMNNLKG